MTPHLYVAGRLHPLDSTPRYQGTAPDLPSGVAICCECGEDLADAASYGLTCCLFRCESCGSLYPVRWRSAT